MDELRSRLDGSIARADSIEMEWRITATQLSGTKAEYEGLLAEVDKVLPELARRYREEIDARKEAQRNEEVANVQAALATAETRKAAQAKDRAERSAQEERLAKDSLDREKRKTDRLNLLREASTVAQNSENIKGDPELRGLMAVYALQTMEQAGGDVNSEEMVRALQQAIQNLELGGKPGVSMERAADQLVSEQDKGLLAMGGDGRIFHVGTRPWKRSVRLDVSAMMDRISGRAFLVAGGRQVAMVDKDGIRVHGVRDKAGVASAQRTPHRDMVRAAARLGEQGILVTGDINGILAVWRQQDNTLRPIKEHQGKGKFRALVDVPAGSCIVGVDGTDQITKIGPEGQVTVLKLPSNEKAWTICSTPAARVLLGTDRGSIWELDPEADQLTMIHVGRGQRIECMAHDAVSGAIAWVDAAKRLMVRAPSKAAEAREFQMASEQIPSAMLFAKQDMLYLSSADGIRPVHCSSRAMAQRICELVGRTWTSEEWREIGTGAPAPTCAGF